MPTFRVTGGVLSIADQIANYPDQGLPGGEPGVPAHPIELPPPPPSVWPGPTPSHPIVIAPPGTPPGTIWPSPGAPSHHPLPPGSPGAPDQTLPPGSPGTPAHPIAPPQPGVPSHPIASQTYWMLVYTPGHGWKYVSCDPSLYPDIGLPGDQPEVTPHRGGRAGP